VSPPFLLVQLSDFHVGAEWADGDPVAGVAAAVAAVGRLGQHPDAVLVTGDLSDNATDAEYGQVRELLEPLRAPVYALPGNHDDVRVLQRHFAPPEADGEPGRYSVDLGPLRLVALDSTRYRENLGALGAERLSWLDAELSKAPAAPTVVAMHHPTFATGVRLWNELGGLPAADWAGLAEVIERHPQVRRLVSGHLHRVITGNVARRAALVIPSTYVQGRLNLAADELELADEPAGFAVHLFAGGELVSHVQPI
jgi:Icc protein